MEFKGIPFEHLNHRQKFLLRRKLKRKKERQTEALLRDLVNKIDESSPEFLRNLEIESELERQAELDRAEQERLWIEREHLAQELFAQDLAKLEAEKLKSQLEKERIQAEWKEQEALKQNVSGSLGNWKVDVIYILSKLALYPIQF